MRRGSNRPESGGRESGRTRNGPLAAKSPHGNDQRHHLLANFSDTAPTFTKDDFDGLFNTVGYTGNGADGSVRDYYLEASYGALTFQTDVYGWFAFLTPEPTTAPTAGAWATTSGRAR